MNTFFEWFFKCSIHISAKRYKNNKNWMLNLRFVCNFIDTFEMNICVRCVSLRFFFLLQVQHLVWYAYVLYVLQCIHRKFYSVNHISKWAFVDTYANVFLCSFIFIHSIWDTLTSFILDSSIFMLISLIHQNKNKRKTSKK